MRSGWLVLLLISCAGQSPMVARQPETMETITPATALASPPVPAPITAKAARDVALRMDNRPTRECAMHCDGAGRLVKLRLDEERDYRFVLMAKKVAARDEFHVSNISRDTNVMLVENADVGSVLTVRGEDALKVCSKAQIASTTGEPCEWTCTFDPQASIVHMKTTKLSADFVAVCY